MSVPYDAEAEKAVLGGAIVWTVNVEPICHSLQSSDFYVPAHQRIFLAIKALHDRGEAVERSVIIDEVRKLGEQDFTTILETFEVGELNIAGAVRVVTEMSLRRRLLAEAAELSKAAADYRADPGTVLDTVRASLASVDTPLSGREPDDDDFDTFLAQTLDKPTPWVIHGLLREGWRTVIVAREGRGKTWLLRQFAVCAAYGIHPLRFTPIRPIRTLLVDLENPDDHLYSSLYSLTRQAKKVSAEVTDVKRLWRRPGGIDLRKRADRSEMETLLVRRRPELLVMGPLYKAFRVTSKDSWDLVASEVQGVLDDWRSRFGLTILMEDHAPKGRDLVPFGSSLWLRWPEIGLGLAAKGNDSLEVKRWRGDRVPVDWPETLIRGRPWPWTGQWPTGTFKDPGPTEPPPEEDEPIPVAAQASFIDDDPPF